MRPSRSITHRLSLKYLVNYLLPLGGCKPQRTRHQSGGSGGVRARSRGAVQLPRLRGAQEALRVRAKLSQSRGTLRGGDITRSVLYAASLLFSKARLMKVEDEVGLSFFLQTGVHLTY